MKLSKREMVLLVVLLVAGGAYLTDHYLLGPLQNQKQHLAFEHDQLTSELQKWEKKTNRYQTLEQEKLQLQDDYQQMLEKIPQLPMISPVIDYLEGRARDTQVEIVSIRCQENAVAQPDRNLQLSGSEINRPLTVNFQIIATGSYFNLLSFIMQLENAPRMYIITCAKISLVRTGPSLPGSAVDTAVNNPDIALSGIQPEALPESRDYKQVKAVLNLIFNAYFYDSSQLNKSVQP